MIAKPVLQTLKHVWVSLEALQLPAALMGGLSVAFWKHPRATRDVDLLVHPLDQTVEAISEALGRVALRQRRPGTVELAGSRLLQLLYEPPESFLDLHVDLLFAETDYQKTAITRRVTVRLPDLDGAIAVLSCEDVILHKLLAGRLLDLADVAALLQANRAALAWDYLHEWIARLGLNKEWSAVRTSPTDPPPPTP